jgi:hypothetical protein
MIVIGLLLVIIAVVFGIDFVWKNNFHITNPTVFGESLGVHSAASLFVVGAITGAVVLAGIVLLLAGARRKGANAASRRKSRQQARRLREDRDTLRAENTDLHSELDQQAGDVDSGATTAPGSDPARTSDQSQDT